MSAHNVTMVALDTDTRPVGTRGQTKAVLTQWLTRQGQYSKLRLVAFVAPFVHSMRRRSARIFDEPRIDAEQPVTAAGTVSS